MASTRTILIVDDEEAFRTALAIALSDEGFHVITAENGERALRAIERTRCDLALVDLQMPVLSGYEFVPAYRAKAGADAPVILCSTRSRSAEAMALKPNAFLLKPCDLDDILHHVQTVLTTSSTQSGAGANRASWRKRVWNRTRRRIKSARSSILSTPLNTV